MQQEISFRDHIGAASYTISPGYGILLASIAILSCGNISTFSLIPPDIAIKGQAIATIALWVTLAAMLNFHSPLTSVRSTWDFVLIIGFYCLAMISFLWAPHPEVSAPKCAALAVTTIAVWACAIRISLLDFVHYASLGLLCLMGISVVLVVFFPEVGLMHNWEHEGAWAGIFMEKQNLGIVGALLGVFGVNLFLLTKRLLYVCQILLSAICIVGSQSRGGLISFLVCALVAIVAWRARTSSFRVCLSLVPTGLLFLATAFIIVLIWTGDTYLTVFGSDLTMNSRTVIWQYGLEIWKSQPLLGTGLEFWFMDLYYFPFLETHGWVLENFHNGYVEVLIQTGLVGYILLVLITFRLSEFGKARDISQFYFSITTSFMAFFYLVNMSESFFFRSTNFLQLTFAFMLLRLCSQPRALSRLS